MPVLSFTGHRPQKLGGYSDHTRMSLFRFATMILREEKPSEVVSGMAQGWDHAVAVAAIMEGIPLTAAVPFKGQENMWPSEAQDRYRGVLAKATTVVVVSEGSYSAPKMMTRNRWMVDRGDKLVALWDGTEGGTSNCVAYAKKQSVLVDNAWDRWMNFQ